MANLVTGAAGFIGTNLTKTLLKQGKRVFGVDSFITGQKENVSLLSKYPNFSFIKGDIVKSSVWKQIDENAKNCKHIFHLACPTGVPNCKKLGIEMLATSTIGTRNVLEFAKKRDARVVFTSSSESYGDPLVFPQSEDYFGNVDPTGFRSPYEEGKRAAESLVLSYTKKHHVDGVIARVFNTYGYYMAPSETRVVPRFLQQALNGKPLTIYGDGMQTRTFTHISDTVGALLILMEKGESGQVYNVGSDIEITISDLAKLIKKTTKSSSKIVFRKSKFSDHNRRLPDIGKIERLGWKPKISLEKGLRKTINESKEV